MSVACLSETSCFTVGDEDNYTLVEHWDGTTWSIVAAPSGASQSQLAQVACASATTCIAVGNYVTASDTKTLVEQSSGTSWAIVASPNAAGATKSVLSGVSCPGSTTCIAVGDSVSPSSTSTLVEQWNGTSWSIVSSPNPAGATKSVLSGVSCATTTSCFAVGEYFDGSDTHGLVESWDGTSWSIATISTPAGASGTTFNGVSCPNATSCSAVGSYDDSSTHTLVDHWDGTTWSVQASPNPSGSQFAALNDVSCATTTTCVAVGESIGGPVGSQTGRTLAERWNGTSWSIVASPTPSGSLESALMGVSCPSATNCYAVGSNQSSNTVALVEHWNGTTWSQMTVPKPIIATDFVMRGVSCSTTTTCLAVGDYSSPASDYTLIERYA
jgi:hypothetical protein